MKLPLLLIRVVFSPDLSKLRDLDETTARQVFKIAVIEPITLIKLKPFLGALGPICTQNVAPFQVWLVQAWRPHSCISHRISLKNNALLQKFENHLKWLKMPLL